MNGSLCFTFFRKWTWLLFLFIHHVSSAQSSAIEWQLSPQLALFGQQYPAHQAKHLVIMIPSRQGFDAGYEDLAEKLTNQQVTVWQPDWFSSYDRTPSESALNSIPTTDIATLLNLANQQGLPVHLMAFGRGAPIALQGWREWQKQVTNQPRSSGIILVSPNLIAKTPDPGEPAQYLSVVDAMDSNIWIYQPSLSPYFNGVSSLVERLSQQGSNVWLQPLIGMRDRFFYRPDANATEQQFANDFAGQLRQAMQQLAHNRQTHFWHPLPEKGIEQKQQANTGKLLTLRPKPASDLDLPDLTGQPQQLRQLKGNVILVNFWASWCPPCVHEMPSMQRLWERYRLQGLKLVAVNLGEDANTIRSFSEQHQLKFPIWLDTTQESAQSWKVFAYPTSYLIDRQGLIRYALAGGADWTSSELIKAVEHLLAE